jgi:hypothetical protein
VSHPTTKVCDIVRLPYIVRQWRVLSSLQVEPTCSSSTEYKTQKHKNTKYKQNTKKNTTYNAQKKACGQCIFCQTLICSPTRIIHQSIHHRSATNLINNVATRTGKSHVRRNYTSIFWSLRSLAPIISSASCRPCLASSRLVRWRISI